VDARALTPKITARVCATLRNVSRGPTRGQEGSFEQVILQESVARVGRQFDVTEQYSAEFSFPEPFSTPRVQGLCLKSWSGNPVHPLPILEKGPYHL
jgi:hypothetical protein